MGQPPDLASQTLDAQNRYEITVRGAINVAWFTEAGAVEVRPAAGEETTLLQIITDQAGLVGLIRRLHGVGVVLVCVRQAGP